MSIILPDDKCVEYAPPPSLIPFLRSDKFVNLIVGPVGSGKTSGGLLKIAYEAKRVAPCRDGIRRSRCAVVRNTRQMLWDTTIPDFLKWFPEGEFGVLQRTDSKFVLKVDDVECEVLFRGLDDSNDVRRLLSLQLSFGVMDEYREINPDVFNALTGRLGRYPDKSMNGVGCCEIDPETGKAHSIRKVWGMTNPPDADSFWEQYMSEPPDNAAVFFQPSGLSPEADWIQYLPDEYYENLAEGKSQDWIDVYIHAKFGKTLAGQPVFRSFDPQFHVSKTPLRPIKSENHPLIIGMDFGLTPACTINQQDPRGRFLTFRSLTSDGMGITRFLREKLKPMLANTFPGHPVIIIGDPAGVQRSQTDERSVFDIIRVEGFKVIPARTNTITARIAAVENLLSKQVDGGPAHLIDPEAVEIIRAMRGGYRYKINTKGEMDDKPEKNSHSHVADSHQYACLHIDSMFGSDRWSAGSRAREVKQVKARGWT